MSGPDPFQLQRFLDAQQGTFATALTELGAGAKQSHWMWFVFPQLAGLGRSPMAQHFAIRSAAEASAYLAHPVLGARLRESVAVLLGWAGKRTAEAIFGPLDAMKLRSSLTLFDRVAPRGPFERALEQFFESPDPRTLALLGELR